MRVIHGLGTAAAAALIMTCVAGCPGQDAESAARSAARGAAHHADVHPPPGVIRSGIHLLTDTELWNQVGDKLADASENTEGPVRDALIAAACDSFQQGDYTQAAYTQNLEKELADSTNPPEEQLVDTVSNLASTFDQDAQQGSSAKATVVFWCSANAVHSQVAGG